jgi:hypothetical protein
MEVAALTLNITLATTNYLIQASDRRMVSIPTAGTVDDDANKGLLLQTADGLFAITFAGIGKFRDGAVQRIDMWLAEQMLKEGVPELPIRDGIDRLARAATGLFRKFLKTAEARHQFIVAGWENQGPTPRPGLWMLSNATGPDGRTWSPLPNEAFTVHYTPLKSSFHITGMWEAVPRAARRRLAAALRATSDIERIEQALVETVRAAAMQARDVINGNVLIITITPNGQARATHHPSDDPPMRYAPLFVWYKSGRNFVAGDAWAIPSNRFAYRFGRIMLVPVKPSRSDANNSPESGKIDFSFRMDLAKHKNEPLGDVDIVGVVQA